MKESAVENLVIHSALYGEINILPEQVYHFSNGIIGFEHLNEFALLPYEDSQLFTLQAFSDEIGLMLIPASLTEQHLQFELDKQTIDKLEVKTAEKIIVLYILRIIDGTPYINQKAPIILSTISKKGCQYIVQDDTISVRVPLVLKGGT